MFGTIAHNVPAPSDPMGPPENEQPGDAAVREHRLREWIKRNTMKEEKNEFNRHFAPVNTNNAHLSAKYDEKFIYPDALSVIAEPDKTPGFHGHYSHAMVGSTVPGVVDPNAKPFGPIVNNSDLIPNNLDRKEGAMDLVPAMPGIGDRLQDKNVLNALKKLIFKGTADDKDLDMRNADEFFGRPWRGV